MNAARRSAPLPLLPVAGLLLVLAAGRPAEAAPQDATARYKYGQQLFEQKRYVAAVRAFERALASGGDRMMLYDLARAQQAADMNEAALESYQAFLRAAPMSPLRFEVRRNVKLVRARLRAESGKGAKAPARAPAATAKAAPASAPAKVAASSATPARAPAPPPSAARPLPLAPVSAHVPSVPSAPSVPSVPYVPSDEQGPAASATRPLARHGGDTLQRTAAAVLFGGAAVLGGGIGCLAASAIRGNEVEQAVRFDPEVDSSGQRFQAAGSVLTVLGVVALLVGSELVRRHASRDEVHHDEAARLPGPAPAPAAHLAASTPSTGAEAP